MSNKPQNSNITGLKVLAICGIIAVVLIVACVFFPDQVFGFIFSLFQ